MLPTHGYATKSPTSILEPFKFERRDPGPHDVLVEIPYCGICHSDMLQRSSEGRRIKDTRGRRTVIDGPFVETKEVLGGRTLIQAKRR
jgi:D-arabinose 1-dehydrogenase-like Zn-dependent alcohol dehydrogenase